MLESRTDESCGDEKASAMLSKAGVPSTVVASLGCERVGVVTGLSLTTLVCSGSWGARTNSDPSVEGMNRGRNCS